MDAAILKGSKRAGQFMNRAGAVFQKQGVSFAFHNHSVEFTPIDGVISFKTIRSETDRSLVDFELDIFWDNAAGIDPVEFTCLIPDDLRCGILRI